MKKREEESVWYEIMTARLHARQAASPTGLANSAFSPPSSPLPLPLSSSSPWAARKIGMERGGKGAGEQEEAGEEAMPFPRSIPRRHLRLLTLDHSTHVSTSPGALTPSPQTLALRGSVFLRRLTRHGPSYLAAASTQHSWDSLSTWHERRQEKSTLSENIKKRSEQHSRPCAHCPYQRLHSTSAEGSKLTAEGS